MKNKLMALIAALFSTKEPEKIEMGTFLTRRYYNTIVQIDINGGTITPAKLARIITLIEKLREPGPHYDVEAYIKEHGLHAHVVTYDKEQG